MDKLYKYLISATALVAFSSLAVAQSTIAEWNYNALTGPLNASTGTGVASGSSFPFSNTLPNTNGSARDPGTFVDATGVGGGSGINNVPHSRSGPLAGGASGSNISSWTTDVSGYTNITMSFDMVSTYRMSRFYQILASTDGVTFTTPTGTGSSVTQSGVGSVTVSDSGLMTVIINDGYTPDPSLDPASPVQYLELISYSFSAAYDNAANFAVQIAAIHDPSGSDYVSSFAGTDASDAIAGFDRTGGTRYDLVNISGVPEPGTIAAVMGVIVLGVVMYRRRRR